jgi:exopolysaccharide biosynthesis WecB/TagA/CpsF family protein
VLGKFLLVHDRTEAREVTSNLQKVLRPTIVGFLNAHAVNLCLNDESIAQAFARCDLLLRDGVGTKWLCSMIGLRPGMNMNGTDYIPEILERSFGHSLAIFGTRNPHLDAAACRLREQGFNIMHVEDGFHTDEHYAQLLQEQPASIVILAMGMPRQERCAAYLKQHLRHPCLIICGGAIIDFIGGKARRAPVVMRRLGLEWLFRLLCEPGRLFSRYVTGGAIFVLRLTRLRRAHYRPGPLAGMAKELHQELRGRRMKLKTQRRGPHAEAPSVVLVSPGGRSGGGGMGTVSRTIAEWFEANSPSRCTIIDPRGSGSVFFSPFYMMTGLCQLVLERRRGAKVLHLQLSERLSFPRKGLFALLGRCLGMRIVAHHHGAEFIPVYERAPEIYRAIVRWVVRSSDVNIVLGREWLDYLTQKVGVESDKIRLMYNSVTDIQPQVNALRSVARRARRQTQYLVLANLSPRKGISEFLQALGKLRGEGLSARAVVAGGGEVDRYRQEAFRLGLSECCEFTGWIGRQDVLRLIAASDVLVLPSFNEGLPISILEALCAGLPVITTPVGAIPEVCADGEDCILVRPGDVSELASAMRKLAEDPVLYDALRRNGRRSYESKFTVDGYMSQLFDIYAIGRTAA